MLLLVGLPVLTALVVLVMFGLINNGSKTEVGAPAPSRSRSSAPRTSGLSANGTSGFTAGSRSVEPTPGSAKPPLPTSAATGFLALLPSGLHCRQTELSFKVFASGSDELACTAETAGAQPPVLDYVGYDSVAAAQRSYQAAIAGIPPGSCSEGDGLTTWQSWDDGDQGRLACYSLSPSSVSLLWAYDDMPILGSLVSKTMTFSQLLESWQEATSAQVDDP
jgi:hypothetical protein